MVKWWSTNEPLTEQEARLVAALYKAHSDAVFRANCSTTACQQAAGGSRSLPQSIIAALACLGEMHGPIEAAMDVLERQITYFGDPVLKIPGWGNSFVKGQIDHGFLPVDQCLEANFPRIHNRLREITDALHARGKHVFPNPAAYTGCVALVLGMPRHLSPMLFIQARIEAWSGIFHHTVMAFQKGAPKEEEAA
jgi:citrate synthase